MRFLNRVCNGRLPWTAAILALGLIQGPAAVRATGLTAQVAQSLRVTHDPSPQVEASIAVDPMDPRTVLAGFRDLGVLDPASTYGGLGVAYSGDGGTSFMHLGGVGGGISLVPGFSESGGDPSVGFDTQHRAFYSFLGMSAGLTFQTRSNGLFCATSATAGASWSPAVPIATNSYDGVNEMPFEDKPLLAVDIHPESPFRDNVYLSWARDYPAGMLHPSGTGTGGGDIMFARSTDHGASWAVTGSITTPSLEPLNVGTGRFGGPAALPEPAVAPNGDVFVLYLFRGRLNCSKSRDGALTFAVPTYPFGPTLTTTASIPNLLPNEIFRVNPSPNIETDPVRPGHVYVVAADDDDTPSSTDAANVFFARSVDGGATWEPRIKLNDDGIVAHQFFPWIAVNGFGEIAVIWYDTRNDPANHLLDVYCTFSFDAGETWTPNQRVTESSFEPDTQWPFAPQGPGYMGDYIQVTAAGNTFHLLWTDTRTESAPELEIYHARASIDHPPSVGRIQDQRIVEGETVDVPVRACDPDADPLTLSLSVDPPAGWALLSTGTQADSCVAGVLHLAPGFEDAGAYRAAVTASTGQARDSTTFRIDVANTDRPPAVTAPPSIGGIEGSPIRVDVAAADPDGDAILGLVATPLPLGAAFTVDAGKTAGHLDWTPGFLQAGTYAVTFIASNALSSSATTVMEIQDLNRPPTANPGGPYSGVEAVPISFDGSGSTDPDGSPLQFSWDFGDLSSGVGAIATHAYAASGTFTVALAVTDRGTPPLTDTRATTATIAPALAARVFVGSDRYKVVRLMANTDWCVQIEPVEADFSVTEIRLSTIQLEYDGTGIPALVSKAVKSGDSDGNGLSEIQACFAKSDLRNLLGSLPPGRTEVALVLQGDLSSGARFRGELPIEVATSDDAEALAAAFAPNPPRSSGTLTFRLARPGPVRVTLFDVGGRSVRTLVDRAFVPAGYHEVRINPADVFGGELPSGIYFYRVDTAYGRTGGRIVVVR